MIKIFNAGQIREIDNCTIQQQQISSTDLMERASLAVFELLTGILTTGQEVFVFAGCGNNGGDALAIARMLLTKYYKPKVYLVSAGNKLSPDCHENKGNLERLSDIHVISDRKDMPYIPPGSAIIDGLFGSGLNRPLEGVYLDVIEAINYSGCKVYSIDIPSGMEVADNTHVDPSQMIRAEHVFSFQFPKLSLLLPESNDYCRRMTIVDIGLSEKCIDAQNTDYYYIQKQDIARMLIPWDRFRHKGNNGRGLLVAGSFGKMGAAVLASRACLCTGIGLLTVLIPRCGAEIMQISVPEAMVTSDRLPEWITDCHGNLSKYTIGIGPGIGTKPETRNFLEHLLEQCEGIPMVLDADALNIIATDDKLAAMIPPGSIITPHPAEFDRLYGTVAANGYQRLQNARELAARYNIYIVLKGAYTATVCPQQTVYFNSTGNPGMSTGGSGDVLTGIITSLLAQKYSPLHSALIGVYLHGLAADLAVKDKSPRSLLPSDIIDHLGVAYTELECKSM